jgi:hypothetical protein
MKGHDTDVLVRFAYQHLGEGDECEGRRQVERAWQAALAHIDEGHVTDTRFVSDAIETQDPATLARLFLQLHFYFARRFEP